MTEELCNVQVRKIQHEQENKTKGAYHINLLTNLFRFVDEEKDKPINGFAVAQFEELPESLKERISDEQREWLEKGGNLYLQASVNEFVEAVDPVDFVEHRYRDEDTVSFKNQSEEDLEEVLEQRKPDSEDEEGSDSESGE